jgi:hypothetical protein
MDGTTVRGLILLVATTIAIGVGASPAHALELGMSPELPAGTAPGFVEHDLAHNPLRGEHVAVWFEHSGYAETARTRLLAQRITPMGAAIGTPVQLFDRPYTYEAPSIAFSATSGEYLIAWREGDYYETSEDNRIVAQRFTQDLGAIGSPMVVVKAPTDDIYLEHPHVAQAGGSRFVIVWHTTDYEPEYRAFYTLSARAWNGTSLGTTSTTDRSGESPATMALASGPDGALLVTSDYGSERTWTTVRRVGADGTLARTVTGIPGGGMKGVAAWSDERQEWLVAAYAEAENVEYHPDHRIVATRVRSAGSVLSQAEIAGAPLFDREGLRFQDERDDLDVAPMPGGQWLVVWHADVWYDGGTRAAAVGADGQRAQTRSVELRDPKNAGDWDAARRPRAVAAPGASVVTVVWPEAPGLRGRALARQTPQTTLLSGARPTQHGSERATFTFSGSPAAGTTFECRRTDRDARFAACSSPHVESGLQEDWRYTFEVRAKSGPWVDATPAGQTFWTGYFGPPETTLDERWPKLTTADRARFAFSANEPDVGFRCQLDGGAVVACDSGRIAYPQIGLGDHEFRVWAVDADGNPDPSPEVWTWTRFALPGDEARAHDTPAPTPAPASAPSSSAPAARRPAATAKPKRRTVVRCVRRRAKAGRKVLKVCRRVPAPRKARRAR